MYFYQFNVYAKGSLFTEIVVFFMMITFGGISYLIYNAKDTLRTSQHCICRVYWLFSYINFDI